MLAYNLHWGEALPCLEMLAKQLILLEANSNVFSKCALKSLTIQAGFDSAIRRFDPSRPSQLILLVKLPSQLGLCGLLLFGDGTAEACRSFAS